MRWSLIGTELLVAVAAWVVAFLPATGQKPAPAEAGAEAVATSDPWAAHDPNSREVIGYATIDKVLETFVIDEGGGRTSVPYDRLVGDGERALGTIIGAFEGIAVQGLSRDEQLAYWLNLRTMIVLHQATKVHASVAPKAMLNGPDAFAARKVVTVAGHKLSVADIDRLILAQWRQPHVIYGLVLPARGGPAMPREAFRGATVHDQLNAAGRRFVNRPGVVDAQAKSVRLSSFFIWHRDAIGGDDARLLAHVRTLAAPKLAAKLPASASLTERFDWKLNLFSVRSFDSAGIDRRTVGSNGDFGGADTNSGRGSGGGS